MEKAFTYSENEKAAIVSLLLEMVNIDGNIDNSEIKECNKINEELNISEETFKMGRALDFNFSLHIVKGMPVKKKIAVSKYLTRIIDANDEVTDTEIKLLNKICEQTGLDIILNNIPDNN